MCLPEFGLEELDYAQVSSGKEKEISLKSGEGDGQGHIRQHRTPFDFASEGQDNPEKYACKAGGQHPRRRGHNYGLVVP